MLNVFKDAPKLEQTLYDKYPIIKDIVMFVSLNPPRLTTSFTEMEIRWQGSKPDERGTGAGLTYSTMQIREVQHQLSILSPSVHRGRLVCSDKLYL